VGINPYDDDIYDIPGSQDSSLGTVTSVTATAPVASTEGADPVISMPAATNASAGHATAAQILALEAATSAQHTQNTDTALGAQVEDLDMNTHQVVSLSVPDADGEAIRQTAKITEVNLESAVDHFSSTSDPHDIQDTQVEIYGRAESVRDGFDVTFRNGFVSGCTVNDLTGLNVSIDAGIAFVDGSLFTVSALGSTGLTDNSTNYIYVTKPESGPATMTISTTEPTGEFALREVCYTYATDIHHCSEFPLMSGGLRYLLYKFLKDVIPATVVSGCAVSIDTDATNANDFKVGTGSYFINVFDETTLSSIIYSAGVGHGDSNVEAHYHSSSAWTTGMENGISFDYWDDGTGKHVDGVGKWYCGFIFLHDSTPTYVYPQTEHVREADANTEAIVYPPYHEGYVVPIARFVFRGGVTAFGAAAYFVDIRPFFTTAGGEASKQNIYQTVTGNTGSTTATASDDSIAITGTAPVVATVTADALAVSMAAATASVNGYMTSTFATKLDGIATGANLYVHPNHSGEVTSSADGAQTIATGAVTLAKMANMATDSFIGRTTAESGVPEILSKSDALTILNVADGADVTSTNETSHATVLVDADFASGGLMKTDGFGTYSIVSDTLHTQGTDTALGAQAEDLDMNSHQITALSVPDAAGEAIRQTAKITEVALEALVDGGGITQAEVIMWAIVFGS